MARKFIEERLEQYRIEKAIELYVNENGSLKEISEITVRRIMGDLRKKNIPLRMGEEVFDKGTEHAKKVSPGFRLAALAENHIVLNEWNVMLLIGLDRSTLAQTRA